MNIFKCTLVLAFLVVFVPGGLMAGEEVKVPKEEAPAGNGEKSSLDNLVKKSSYAIGLNLGKQFGRDGLEMDMEALIKGIKDGRVGKALLSDAEIREAMMAMQQNMMKVISEKNIKEGEEFLAAKKKEEGVVALPSGLLYKVIKAGEGAKPAATDQVTTHYKGTLISGEEFDSSYKRGEPATFSLNKVIPGWTEALQLMAVGSKWQLFIPSKLAYGPRATGNQIGPNSTLIFDIELISIGTPGPKAGNEE